MFIDITEVFIL